jgi:hypothetical protein
VNQRSRGEDGKFIPTPTFEIKVVEEDSPELSEPIPKIETVIIPADEISDNGTFDAICVECNQYLNGLDKMNAFYCRTCVSFYHVIPCMEIMYETLRPSIHRRQGKMDICPRCILDTYSTPEPIDASVDQWIQGLFK